MTTFARLQNPGGLVHLVTRFVNREFIIRGDAEREAYLERLATAIVRTDWRMLAFGIMSDHIHLVLLAGNDPPSRVYQSVHCSFAAWVNRTQGRLGPVFAARPRTIYFPPERLGVVVAYAHNNPVRAGVVASPDESNWTSHRMWIGQQSAPPWMSVNWGLSEAGWGTTSEGRADFHEFVRAAATLPRDEAWNPPLELIRKGVRAGVALPIEVSSPVLTPKLDDQSTDSPVVLVRSLGPLPVSPRWEGELQRVVDVVAGLLGVRREEVLSRCHLAKLAKARRVVAVTAVLLLRRQNIEAAAALGISAAAVSRYLRGAAEVMPLAAEVARRVRALDDGVIRLAG